jgi:hypothetical protein
MMQERAELLCEHTWHFNIQFEGQTLEAVNKHRMPVCCHVLRANMRPGDQILAAPPKGDKAMLEIRYRLPR